MGAGVIILGRVSANQPTAGSQDRKEHPLSLDAGSNLRITGALNGLLPVVGGTNFKFIAASQTNVPVASSTNNGGNGSAGDILDLITIIPANTSPGNVSIRDSTGSANTIFVGGANSVSNTVPFTVPGPGASITGNWNATTGANVSIMGRGKL